VPLSLKKQAPTDRFPRPCRRYCPELNGENAILDGELAATDEDGRTVFAALMQRSKEIHYLAFDLLWLNGRDLRPLPLLARKDKLKRLLPARSPHMLYVDHVRATGTELYQVVGRLDLEGIVAKKADSPYEDNWSNPYWVKIKNANYSQNEGRGDLFKRGGSL
jgi:bifunctional non-homologous end joining protein LigD